jgi:hypothetical protein
MTIMMIVVVVVVVVVVVTATAVLVVVVVVVLVVACECFSVLSSVLIRKFHCLFFAYPTGREVRVFS